MESRKRQRKPARRVNAHNDTELRGVTPYRHEEDPASSAVERGSEAALCAVSAARHNAGRKREQAGKRR